MQDFKFTIITTFYNSQQYLEQSIQSVLEQDIGFEDNVQLILVDDGSNDDSADIANKYKKLYPNNICVLSQKNNGPASGRNLGLKYARGKYVNFLDSDDKLSSNSLKSVDDFFKKHDNIDLIALPLILFEKQTDNHYLNFKFENKEIINLKKDYDYSQLSVSSCFIKHDIIQNNFNENLTAGADLVFINEILLNNPKYALINNAEYYYRQRFDGSEYSNKLFNDKKTYTDKLNSYKHLINTSIENEGKVLKFIQYLIILDLKTLINAEEFKSLFNNNDDDLDMFWDLLNQVLDYIDSEIILKHRFLNPHEKNFLIYLKNKDFHINIKSKKVTFKSKNHTITKLHNRKIRLDIVEFKNGFLNISGFFTSNCFKDCISIEAVKITDSEEVKFTPEYVEYYDRKTESFLGIDWKFKTSFDFKIPVEKDKSHKLYFNIVYNENEDYVVMPGKVRFTSFSNLSNLSRYFVKDNVIVNFNDDCISTQHYSYGKMLKYGFNDISSIFSSHEEGYLTAILFRFLYLLLYPFFSNKRIWLFQDRLTVADDNAEHLFKYSVKQDDNIRKYFIIKDSPDFKRMKSVNKNIVEAGSFKHKLLYLFGEKIISSHVDHSVLNPFYNDNLILYNGLFTIERCFLQHGITKDNMSYWIKKHYVNLFLFLTSAQAEYESLFNEEYNYSENVVQLLGFPRYDTLNNDNVKKQVLFMPTWRNYIRGRDLFKNSNHFLRINSFINNTKLLDYLNKNNYKLIFKPHFEIYEHIDLFNIPDEVEVSVNESYQTLFNESSILITDFSSVAFDFAYLKKPLLYYQAEDDYHNLDSYFDYETMGFGSVVRSEDELVDSLIECIENDCKINTEYLNRIDSFYKFNDKNNCKRVYDWMKTNR